MDDWVVEFRGATRQFGSLTAVDRMDLRVRRGEFFSLLGPSGCGKTTVLKLIAGFEKPDSGQIFINGEEVDHLPPYKRKVNTVFQHYALFPHLNVFENIAFGLRRRKLPEKQIKEKVDWGLNLVQLANSEKSDVTKLSGGQQQRVALARAIVNEPEVLLLDEPLSALDQKLRHEMQFQLKELQKRVGITFIFVTHDQEEAFTMSDSIAIINKGHIEQIGTPREIYNHPSTVFTAKFIGITNFIPVQVTEILDDKTKVEIAGQEFLIPSRQGLEKGQAASLSLRPECARISRDPESNNRLQAEIKESVFMGASTQIVSVLSNGTKIIIESQNQIFSSEPEFKPGEKIWINWEFGSAVLLPEAYN